MDTGLVRGNLDLMLLTALESGESYGLELSKAIASRSAGYFSLNVGSLYPALHRLERAGWLAAEDRQPPRGGPAVRYYRLTDAGRAELTRRREAYQTFDRAMQALWSAK